MATTSPSQGAKPASPELVFGLVGALGCDLENVGQRLSVALESIGYKSSEVRVSELIHEFDVWTKPIINGLDEHVEQHQRAGNEVRKTIKRGDALGLAAIVKIRKIRKTDTGNPDRPMQRHAYVIRSLKRPEEVDALRRVYGTGFFLIGVYSPKPNRIDKFVHDVARSRGEPMAHNKYRAKAEELIETDQHEMDDQKFGQNVRDTYPRADVFIDASKREAMGLDIARFIEMLFRHPFQTPRRDEYVMFHAQAAAFRSADPARQVGAAIADSDGNVVAVGTNEVPKVGGGLYWAGESPDRRDFTLDLDVDMEMRKDALGEILERLQRSNWLGPDISKQPISKLRETVVPLMEGTKVMGLGEFGRMVHAEMAAILDAARKGAATQGHILYCTTFPCHNCAKHIIASGLARVVYIEPYPKSVAKDLHADEIIDDRQETVTERITFGSFIGIAPRQYLNMFSMVPRRAGKKALESWNMNRKQTLPRSPEVNAHLAYVPREKEAVSILAQAMGKG